MMVCGLKTAWRASQLPKRQNAFERLPSSENAWKLADSALAKSSRLDSFERRARSLSDTANALVKRNREEHALLLASEAVGIVETWAGMKDSREDLSQLVLFHIGPALLCLPDSEKKRELLGRCLCAISEKFSENSDFEGMGRFALACCSAGAGDEAFRALKRLLYAARTEYANFRGYYQSSFHRAAGFLARACGNDGQKWADFGAQIRRYSPRDGQVNAAVWFSREASLNGHPDIGIRCLSELERGMISEAASLLGEARRLRTTRKRIAEQHPTPSPI